MHLNFLVFLPYSKKHELKDLNSKHRLMKLLEYFCKISKKTIKCYFYGEYRYFDPQVGENLCQIRAYQLYSIFNESLDMAKEIALFSIRLQEFHDKCEQLLEKLNSLKTKRPSHYLNDIDKHTTVEEYLERNQLNIHLTDNIAFLIQSYFLTIYKIIDEHEICYGVDYNELSIDLNITSKTFIKNLVRHNQIKITESSSKFLSSLLLNTNAEPALVYLMHSLHFKDQDGRHVFGCYEATRLILDHAFKTGRPVCIIVKRNSETMSDELVFYLKPDNNLGKYTVQFNASYDKPNILITGVTRYSHYINETAEEYVRRFLNVGFENIILANVAQHPQYPGISLDKFKYNPYLAVNTDRLTPSYKNYISNAERNFLKHKHLAAEVGCMPDNASLFLMTHVRSTSYQQGNENLHREAAL
jgi:hypothetical protein